MIEKDDQNAVLKRVSYTYDSLDRLITRQVDGDGNGPVDETQHFAYDNDQITLAFDSAGSLANRYLHGELVDQIMADENALGEVLWPLADHQSTVRDLAQYDAVSGDTDVANHITYDAFGNRTAETNASVDHLSGYTGQFHDELTGLSWYRARWYDPPAGRFLNEDPIGFAAGDANLYRYVGNSPMVFTDPSGLSAFNPISKVVNAIAGVTSSLASPVMSVASSVASAASSVVRASLGGSSSNLSSSFIQGITIVNPTYGSNSFSSTASFTSSSRATQPAYTGVDVLLGRSTAPLSFAPSSSFHQSITIGAPALTHSLNGSSSQSYSGLSTASVGEVPGLSALLNSAPPVRHSPDRSSLVRQSILAGLAREASLTPGFEHVADPDWMDFATQKTSIANLGAIEHAIRNERLLGEMGDLNTAMARVRTAMRNLPGAERLWQGMLEGQSHAMQDLLDQYYQNQDQFASGRFGAVILQSNTDDYTTYYPSGLDSIASQLRTLQLTSVGMPRTGDEVNAFLGFIGLGRAVVGRLGAKAIAQAAGKDSLGLVDDYATGGLTTFGGSALRGGAPRSPDGFVPVQQLESSAARLRLPVAVAPTQYPEGSFSVSNWSGYPQGVPRPQGPFRLVEGAEYDAARNAANAANRAIHRADPSLAGQHIHEIQPVKFGGSPTNPANKIPLTPQQHAPVTNWWYNLMRSILGD